MAAASHLHTTWSTSPQQTLQAPVDVTVPVRLSARPDRIGSKWSSMAYPVGPHRRSSQDVSHDPVLQQVAKHNTFDSDWPTLRHHLHLALLAVPSLFQSLGPPQPPPSPPTPVSRGRDEPSLQREVQPKSETEDQKPPAESLLLSPSQPSVELQSTTPPANTSRQASNARSINNEPPTSPSIPRDAHLRDELEYQGSTQGGLILPPFPPLDTSRRRRESSVKPIMPVISPLTLRLNGHLKASPAPTPARVTSAFDDEWDEDIVIGGKKMPGWMEEDDGKQEVEKLVKVLDGMESAPFTIQRIAELLLDPTAQHTVMGKYLRALEKTFLVTSPWEPPTYTYVPGATAPGVRSMYAGSTSSASSIDLEDNEVDSTMPPGPSTPMFSPIPFLVRSDREETSDEFGDLADSDLRRGLEGIETGGGGSGLMSPLMLGGETSTLGGGFQFQPAPSVRSPTPEPDSPSTSPSAGPSRSPESPLSGSTSSDPSHQPYLGRVDELDTGPLAGTPVNGNGDLAHGHARRGREEDQGASNTGTGEGGNMTPHGMSERPVPITRTTIVLEEDRRIAGMPKAGTGEHENDGNSPGTPVTLQDRFVTASSGDAAAGDGNGTDE